MRVYPNSKVELTCEGCATKFSVYPSRLKNAKVRFCSSKCQNANCSGENNPNWKGGLIKRECIECGTSFEVKQKVVRNGDGKFCSHTCFGNFNGKIISKEALKKRIPKTCIVCSKVKLVKPSHADKEGTYCSVACMQFDYSTRLKGHKNPNFQDKGHTDRVASCRVSKRQRTDAKKIKTHSAKEWEALKLMYKNTCPCCKKKGIKLTKDHIIPITKGGHNGIENIQPLCKRCNSKKFTKTIVYPFQLGLPIAEVA